MSGGGLVGVPAIRNFSRITRRKNPLFENNQILRRLWLTGSGKYFSAVDFGKIGVARRLTCFLLVSDPFQRAMGFALVQDFANDYEIEPDQTR